jgi:uncharacterized membrane protein YfcA
MFTFFDYPGVSAGSWVLFSLATGFAGICMGVVGVGGVVVVPAAIAILGEEPKVAIASTVPGYIACAAVGSWSYWDLIRAQPRLVAFVVLGATVGGFVAAFALRSLPAGPLGVGVALFATAFGVKALLGMLMQKRKSEGIGGVRKGSAIAVAAGNDGSVAEIGGSVSSDSYAACDAGTVSLQEDDVAGGAVNLQDCAADPQAPAAGHSSAATDAINVFLGLVVGFGSALTGTSGPLLCIPCVMLLRPSTQPKEAVALAMSLGVPMAAAMTAGNISNDQPMDLGLSVAVAIATSLFVPVGRALSRWIEAHFDDPARGNDAILCAISIVLIATGVSVCVKQFS